MTNGLQADIMDFVKLGVLLLLMGVIAFDILVVRSDEKELRRITAARMAEFEAKAKEMEAAHIAAEADLRRRLKEAEQRVLAERRNTEKVEEEKRQQEEAYEKKLMKSEENYMSEIEKLKISFESQIQALDVHRNPTPPQRIDIFHHESQTNTKDSPIVQTDSGKSKDSPKRMKHCDRCRGTGEIQQKMMCDYCGGSGRMKETYILNKRYDYSWSGRNAEKLSAVYQDCPHCLPGGLKGSGSKGYTIMTLICPKCDGKGKVERD